MKHQTNVETMPTLLAIVVIFICLCIALTAEAQTSKSCSGVTVKGTACMSIMIVKGTEFCRLHQPDAEHCKFIKRDKSQCKMVIKKGATYCRFHQNKTTAFTPTF